jgi:serine/threonine-protein kinase HipA
MGAYVMRAEIYVDEEIAGYLERVAAGYRFTYCDAYRGEPVSLTMPLSQKVYDYEVFPPFFDGLLPEGSMLESLLRRAKLDRDDFLGQLIAIGRDVVGNVTIRAA